MHHLRPILGRMSFDILFHFCRIIYMLFVCNFNSASALIFTAFDLTVICLLQLFETVIIRPHKIVALS